LGYLYPHTFDRTTIRATVGGNICRQPDNVKAVIAKTTIDLVFSIDLSLKGHSKNKV